MPLSDAERQARRRARLTLERDGFKATIGQLLQEIARLRQGDPAIDRELRELRAKVVQLEADNARLVRELEALRKARAKAPPKPKRTSPPRMDRGTFAKVARALHPDGRGARTPAELDDACKAFNSWWDTQ
jgi:septal ring factor EnvC (AmiA/AmiB activator)